MGLGTATADNSEVIISSKGQVKNNEATQKYCMQGILLWWLTHVVEMYTLHQKEVTFSSSIFPGDRGSGSVNPGSFACYSQDHLTESSKLYIRVSNPRASGRMERLNVNFLWEECIRDIWILGPFCNKLASLFLTRPLNGIYDCVLLSKSVITFLAPPGGQTKRWIFKPKFTKLNLHAHLHWILSVMSFIRDESP